PGMTVQLEPFQCSIRLCSSVLLPAGKTSPTTQTLLADRVASARTFRGSTAGGGALVQCWQAATGPAARAEVAACAGADETAAGAPAVSAAAARAPAMSHARRAERIIVAPFCRHAGSR